MSTIRNTLHEKRKLTEDRVRQRRREGEQTVRYTAMMPDIPFLVLGLLSDIGCLIHLAAGTVSLCGSGFHSVPDYAAALAMAALLFGIGFLIHLNKLHEKEIATKLQKDLRFGVTAYSGLAGAVIAGIQIAAAGAAPALIWVVIGGILNFASALPIYLSCKKGIVYGVK